jgi:AcrR family transcriptional regulator
MNANTPPSPPKQARALATRSKLLDATVQSLCEAGYAGTTTTTVARRAGVSQGALYKQFGSKQHLMAATTEHLFGGLIQQFRRAFAKGASGADPAKRALEELWKVFLARELYAVMELYIRARTDEDLRGALVPVLERHRANLLKEARTLFPEAARENPRFDAGVDTVLSAMQGAAMTAGVMADLSRGLAFNEFLLHLWRREVEAPYGGERV